MRSSGSWKESLGVYFSFRMAGVFFLGVSSGLPLLLTGSTLFARLKDGNVELSTIGLFALLSLPYTLKFLWAPAADQVRIFYLGRILGHRRSWMLVSQIFLMLCLFGMGHIDVTRDVAAAALLSLCIAFFSSVQDIVIDAYRVELLQVDEQAAGAAMVVSGYRIGMLLTGAGALALADSLGWGDVYILCGLLMLIGMITVFFLKEGKRDFTVSTRQSFPEWFKRSVILPFTEFFRREYAVSILLFIALFKLGDALAGALSMPFYLEMGFSKESIAGISKVFGLGTTLFGAFLGGIFVRRHGMMHGLLLCGVLQLLSNFAFVWLSYVGDNHAVLVVVIAVENISGGMGTAAFVGYMSSLCHREFTATQYALLSSLSSVGRTLLSSSTGFIVEVTGWSLFFVFTAVAAVPGLLLLKRIWGISGDRSDEMPLSS